MKILIVADTYPPQINGAAYFAVRLAQGLVERGHRILGVVPARGLANEEYSEGGMQMLRLHSIPLYVNNTRVALPFTAQALLRRTITEFAPDIVHAQGHFGLSQMVVRIAKQRGVPVVGTNHFMPENLTHYLALPDILEDRLNAFLWRKSYDFFASLEAVTTPTKTAAELFTQRGFSKPVQVLSNGIDVDRFKPGVKDDAIGRQYGLDNKPTAMFVGRLDKEKHIDEVLESVKLAIQMVDLQLVIVGSDRGGEAKHLREIVRRLDLTQSVIFTGFVSDEILPAIYRWADVFVMPGTAELQSIATLEAMASGLPVIASNAVALPELVHENENGYLFKPGDTTVLSKRLMQVLSDLPRAKRMGETSRQIACLHAQDAVLEKFEDLYEKLIEDAGTKKT